MFVVCLGKWRVYNSGNSFFPPFYIKKIKRCHSPDFSLKDMKLRVFSWEWENWHWYSFHPSFCSCAASWVRFIFMAYLMQWAAVSTQLVAMRVPPQVWRHWPLELYWREAWDQGTKGGSGFCLLILHCCALFLHPEHNLLMVKGFELSNSWPWKSFPALPIIQSLIFKIYLA